MKAKTNNDASGETKHKDGAKSFRRMDSKYARKSKKEETLADDMKSNKSKYTIKKA